MTTEPTVISKTKAERYVWTDETIRRACAEWTTSEDEGGYGYSTAAIIPAVNRIIPGHDGHTTITKSRTRFSLVLDGEVTEIEFSFYRYDDNTVEFEPTHWHD